jgi:hypothetical protein
MFKPPIKQFATYWIQRCKKLATLGTENIKRLSSLTKPKVYGLPVSIDGVSVKRVTPFIVHTRQQSPRLTCQGFRVPVLEESAQPHKASLHVTSASKRIGIGQHWPVTHRRLPLITPQSLPTQTLYQQWKALNAHHHPVALPPPKHKTASWQPPTVPASWRYPLAAYNKKLKQTVGNALPVGLHHINSTDAIRKARRLPITRTPLPAHRFSLAKRDQYRSALGQSLQKKLTPPNGNPSHQQKPAPTDILLRGIVDRIPIGRTLRLTNQPDGSVTYLLKAGKNEGLEVVVSGKHLTTRQSVTANCKSDVGR